MTEWHIRAVSGLTHPHRPASGPSGDRASVGRRAFPPAVELPAGHPRRWLQGSPHGCSCHLRPSNRQLRRRVDHPYLQLEQFGGGPVSKAPCLSWCQPDVGKDLVHIPLRSAPFSSVGGVSASRHRGGHQEQSPRRLSWNRRCHDWAGRRGSANWSAAWCRLRWSGRLSRTRSVRRHS
jgi:hypothetical protein